MSAPDRRAMVERPGKDLSVRRQCALVGMARSGVYRPKPVTRADDLAAMRADGREARAGIGSWMTFYNFRRPHQAMNNQMPMAVWRAGMDKIEAAARAVDMPLRLDNANALPTYPQQKQKQQEAA